MEDYVTANYVTRKLKIVQPDSEGSLPRFEMMLKKGKSIPLMCKHIGGNYCYFSCVACRIKIYPDTEEFNAFCTNSRGGYQLIIGTGNLKEIPIEQE